MGDLWLMLVLLILSGFFSGAEIAFFSIGAEKIQALKNQAKTEKERQRIIKLELLKANPQKLLVTILIGNNIVNVGASAIATLMATGFADKIGYEGNQGMVVGMVTGVMTFLILLFGEITPKSLAHKHAISFSLLITPVLNFLQFILFPIVYPLSKLVKKFSGDEEISHSLNEEELKAALDLSEKEGKIESSEKQWVKKILEFGDHTVENVMTPRSKIFALEDHTDVREAVVQKQLAQVSRTPIYHEDLDDVIGILSVHGIIEKLSEPDFWENKVANLPLTKPFKVPVTMKIDTLLHEFQSENKHMALVYDEHGGLVGLITLEDVLEEIFGEIQDEQDMESIDIRQIGKQKFIFSGETELEQLENFIREKLEKKAPERFPWEIEDENKTFGLFILEKLEKFPEEQEVINLEKDYKKFKIIVEKFEDDKILEVSFEIE